MTRNALTLLQGTVDLLVLRALQVGPSHGYSVSRWVRERTDGVLTLEDAALYQALYRMEKRGLVKATWGVTEGNRRARYYRITAAGRAELATQTTQWVRYAETMNDILLAAPGSARA